MIGLESAALGLMRRYHGAAWWIERHASVSDTVLHINVGLAVWLATVLLRGRRWGDRINLVPILLLEGLNELADYLFPNGWTLSDTIADVVWTMVWPAVLTWMIGSGAGAKRRRR